MALISTVNPRTINYLIKTSSTLSENSVHKQSFQQTLKHLRENTVTVNSNFFCAMEPSYRF